MNDKFNIQPIKCGDIEIFWCSFPKEFKDVCERAANIYGMSMKTMARVMVSGSFNANRTAIEFPDKENILSFEGKRTIDQETLSNLSEGVFMVGNLTETLGVD